MDYTGLMSILTTAQKKACGEEQQDKGKMSGGKSLKVNVDAILPDNEETTAAIVEPMTHIFKPARGAKIGLNDKWAEFEEKMKQQKREEMRRKAEEIKHRLEDEEQKEKEEKARLKQEKREQMIKEKKKIWEEQFGQKKSEGNKKIHEDKSSKYKKHSDSGYSGNSKNERKRGHTISGDEVDNAVKSGKLSKSEPEKIKQPKIKKFNRQLPPPVNFQEILRMAEEKQHEPVEIKKAEKIKKVEDRRPLSQYEKDRLERIKSMEYKNWVKYGKGRPSPTEARSDSSNGYSSEENRHMIKKNSALISASFNSAREFSPVVSKMEHASLVPKKEHLPMNSQKRPTVGHERSVHTACHSIEKLKNINSKIPNSNLQNKGSLNSSSSQSSKSYHSSDNVSRKSLSKSAIIHLPSSLKHPQNNSSLQNNKKENSPIVKKPKIHSSEARMTEHFGHSKFKDIVQKESLVHKKSNDKIISKPLRLNDKIKDSSARHTSGSIHEKHHKQEHYSSLNHSEAYLSESSNHVYKSVSNHKSVTSLSSNSMSNAIPSKPLHKFKTPSDHGHSASCGLKSSNTTCHSKISCQLSSKHSVISIHKMSQSLPNLKHHSEKKMMSKLSSGSSQHKPSNNKVIENSHDKAAANHKQVIGRKISKDRPMQSSKIIKISEKEVNRLKLKSPEMRKNNEANSKIMPGDKGIIKHITDSKYKISSSYKKDLERSKGKGDGICNNNYDSVHEKVLICGPSAEEEAFNKKPSKPVASNPWDRIYGEMKKKNAKPVKKKNVIDSDSEEDEEMADFIDDDDSEIEDPADLDYSKYIKQIFGYDRNKYHDDDDVDDMESSYSALMKEEARSARIGLLEDLEDMKREEEEFKQKMLQKKIRRI